jgi:phenol/toluene 2-monooxygenase (NADH) P1/A1
MQLDLRTVSIKPLRQTFSHVAKRIGADKAASRYQEGTFDLQATMNFHYRPLWAPEYEIFDASRTAVVMADWYKLLDPRQYYYGSYTLARARMQEAAEADFALVEDRGLADSLPHAVRRLAMDLYLPLRHLEWGGNTNCMSLAAYGFGTAFTSPALFHAMDHLGMAQYLTRLGLVLGDEAELAAAKQAWIAGPEWQGLRKYIEDCFVIEDWFELFTAHCVVLDGLLFPLFFGEIDTHLAAQGGGAVLSMLTRFEAEWFTDACKWTNAVIKNAASESAANKAQIESWIATYLSLAQAALEGPARSAFGAEAPAVIEQLTEQFSARLAKLGVSTAQKG